MLNDDLRHGPRMNQSLLAGLFLTLASGSAELSSGSGFFQQILGEFNQVSWGLDSGLTGVDARSTGVGPAPCTGACPFNFTAAPASLPFANSGGYVVIPSFRFSGPTVTATAICTPCNTPPNQYDTFWGPAAISLTGVVRFVSSADPTQFTEFNIVGSGTARAENHFNQAPGPWNYSATRYEFRYTVVPEPEVLLLFGAGAIGLLVVTRQRERRRTG
jgi:PEP-CTERM motif